jgi:hypothetical protein
MVPAGLDTTLDSGEEHERERKSACPHASPESEIRGGALPESVGHLDGCHPVQLLPGSRFAGSVGV